MKLIVMTLWCLMNFANALAQTHAGKTIELSPELESLATALVENKGEDWIGVRYQALKLPDEEFDALTEYLSLAEQPAQHKHVAAILHVRRNHPDDAVRIGAIVATALRPPIRMAW